MSAKDIIFKNRDVVLRGPVRDLNFTRAVIEEGLSEPLCGTVEFAISDRNLDFDQMLGRDITVRVSSGEEKWREFCGVCTEIEYMGLFEGLTLYRAEIRSWFWLLTLTENQRVFQEMTVVDIAKKILGENGFSNYKFNTSQTYAKRPYTVQHAESDFAFLSRLFEEAGIYYFSTSARGKETVHFVDGVGGHTDVPDAASIQFNHSELDFRRNFDHIFDWASVDRITSGKVTLSDYNFEKPKADLKAANSLPKGTHMYKGMERYRSPGRYRETADGTVTARVGMEGIAGRHKTRRAVGNVPTLAVGHTFTLTDHPRSIENADYLITRARHELQIEQSGEDVVDVLSLLPGRLPKDPTNRDRYRGHVEVMPKNAPFRPDPTTPWPQIPGIMLAKVVGPSGEEIFTDKYGRIKIQFPWDRQGKNNNQSSCFVRCVMPWSGKQWGFVSVPRIGQEVVIQFEDGNPDRPICTGMLYNADNMPPYALPDNMTQTGLKTNSSKGGGGYNELMFEDKKGAELVRMQAEKDFDFKIKNNSVVTVGLEKKDPGNLTQTIHNNLTTTVKQGDHTFKVETGNEVYEVKGNQTEKIEGNLKKDVSKNSEVAVTGNDKLSVTGNQTVSITGNQKLTITGTEKTETTGSADWSAKAGITIESPATITLKVGASKIVLSQAGIEISGMSLTTKGSLSADHSGGLAMSIKAAIVNIN